MMILLTPTPVCPGSGQVEGCDVYLRALDLQARVDLDELYSTRQAPRMSPARRKICSCDLLPESLSYSIRDR